MKILFLCGSLEVGRDGVGDYSRRLAAELTRQSHQPMLMSISDKFTERFVVETQYCGETEIKVARVPLRMNHRLRLKLAKNEVTVFNPDFISLQFVHFSFHNKGLPFFLGSFIQNLTEGRKLQVMFHELWVGMEKGASLKMRLWRLLQRRILYGLVAKTKPRVIHTQSSLYQTQLAKHYTNVNLLPLFSNIEPVEKYQSCKSRTRLENNTRTFIVFGSIHPGAPIEVFAKELNGYAQARKIKIVVKFIGHNGTELEHWLKTFEKMNISTEVIGRQNEEDISKHLYTGDFGLSSTPFAVIEKSGSVAAMREHGLTVICVAKTWIPALNVQVNLPAGIVYYTPGNIERCLTSSANQAYENGLAAITKKFVTSLTGKDNSISAFR